MNYTYAVLQVYNKKIDHEIMNFLVPRKKLDYYVDRVKDMKRDFYKYDFLQKKYISEYHYINETLRKHLKWFIVKKVEL